MAQMNLSIDQKQIHRPKIQICGSQGGGRGSGMDWEFGSRRKLLYLEWISNEVLLHSTRNYTQSLVVEIIEDNMRQRMCTYIHI